MVLVFNVLCFYLTTHSYVLFGYEFENVVQDLHLFKTVAHAFQNVPSKNYMTKIDSYLM